MTDAVTESLTRRREARQEGRWPIVARGVPATSREIDRFDLESIGQAAHKAATGHRPNPNPFTASPGEWGKTGLGARITFHQPNPVDRVPDLIYPL
jgi:hypothetical protein